MEFSSLLPIATAFGLALMHSLWIGAVLYVGVRALLPLLPGPAARHHLSYGALLALAAAFSYTLYAVYDPTPVCENLLAAGQAGNGSQPLAEAGIGAATSWAEWFSNQVFTWAPWFSGAYLLGLFPALFYLILDQERVRALRTNGLTELPAAWGDHLEEVLASHPLTRRVKCYLSDRAGEVMTLGFWSPIIVFPVALVNELTPEMARTILLHELAHLRHYDHWLNYPQQIIRAFFFFHPAAHALCKLIDREREHRCDDWVASRCSDRRTYASALVTVARSSHIPPNNLVMSATKTPFSQRIQRLFQGDNNRSDRNFAFSMLLVVLLSGAQLGYLNLGADAGAADCLEEQGKTASLTAMDVSLLVFQQQEDHYPSAYELSKRHPASDYRWVVTEPGSTNEPVPCPTRLTAEQLPYVAAPEVPESTNPRAMEAYERARLKYAEIQKKTQISAQQKEDRYFTSRVHPVYFGIREQAAPPKTPCNTTTTKAKSISPLPASSHQAVKSVKQEVIIAPRISARTASQTGKSNTLITISKSHKWDCSTTTTNKELAVTHNGLHTDESADLATGQVEEIAVLASTEVISKLEPLAFKGLVLTSSKKMSSTDFSLSMEKTEESRTGRLFQEAPAINLSLPVAQVEEVTIEEEEAEEEVIYLIDGEQVDEAAFTSLRSEDIESISVFKDEQQLLEKGCAAKDGLISVITKNSVF